MLQQQFIEFAKNILLRGQADYNSCYHPRNKVQALQDMGDQLEELRKSYCRLSGKSVDMPQFSSLLGLEQ
jgi:hypothetical protein